MPPLKELLEWAVGIVSIASGLFGIWAQIAKRPPGEVVPYQPAGKPRKVVFRRFWRKYKSGILGGLFLLAGIVIISPRFIPETPLGQLTRQELITRMFKLHDEERWQDLVRYADWLIDKNTLPAENANKAWFAEGKTPPKVGIVGAQLTKEDERRNHEYGAVNDLATAYFLKGVALRRLQEKAAARNAFEMVKQYTNAVTYNPKTREFWRTMEGAENELFQMAKEEGAGQK